MRLDACLIRLKLASSDWLLASSASSLNQAIGCFSFRIIEDLKFNLANISFPLPFILFSIAIADYCRFHKIILFSHVPCCCMMTNATNRFVKCLSAQGLIHRSLPLAMLARHFFVFTGFFLANHQISSRMLLFHRWHSSSLIILLICLLLVFSDIFPTLNSIPFGRRRRRRDGLVSKEEFASSEEAPCEALCDAQFARDFEEEFGHSYFTHFFDFPIDPLLTSSSAALQSFCSLIKDRSCCLRRECHLESIPPSPQTFLCLEHRAEFEQALKCLNATNAHFNFHAVCSNAAKRSIDLDRELVETKGFSEAEVEQYHQQDLRCRFQACIVQARLLLMDQHCGQEERMKSQQTVLSYYLADLELDLAEYAEQLNATKHFPRFCANFLIQQRGEGSALIANDDASKENFETEMRMLLEATGADRKRNGTAGEDGANT